MPVLLDGNERRGKASGQFRPEGRPEWDLSYVTGERANAKQRERVGAEYWRRAPRFYLGHRQDCLCY